MAQEKEFLWDDRAPSFRLLADGAKLVAKRYGIETDETTYHRWSDAGGLIRELDTLHDDFGVSAEEIIERLQGYEEFRDLYPHLAPENLEPEKRDMLFGIARNIFHIGARAALMTDKQEFAEARLEEGEVTAHLATDIATDEMLAHPNYESQFVPAMENFTVGGVFFDSLLDGFIDYRRGKTMVKPDWEYYNTLRNVGRTGMRSALGLMAHPAFSVLILNMAQKRIRTRFQNGMTSYSSIQNVPDFFRHNIRHKNE